MKEHKRRFSLEKDFMNHNTSDLIYGFMRSISTITDEELLDGQHKEYLPHRDMVKNKRTIAGICGCSTKTVDRKIEKLREAGLIKEVLLQRNNANPLPVYIFPYDANGLFKVVEKDMIKYLVSTRQPFAIRIYLYLLNKSGMKKNYVFTIRELTTIALGYASSTQVADEIVKTILQSFSREGVIKCHTEWQVIDDNISTKMTYTQRYILDNVVKSVSELKPTAIK